MTPEDYANASGPLTIAKLRAARKILQEAEVPPSMEFMVGFQKWQHAVFYWRHGLNIPYGKFMSDCLKTLREKGSVDVYGFRCILFRGCPY